MTEQGEPVEAGAPQRVRVDWRTGPPMVQHDEAFWREHEQRRLEQGVSMPRYCAANGLALLSTYRHRVNGKKRANAEPASSRPTPMPTPSRSAAFVPVSTPRLRVPRSWRLRWKA